MIVLLSLWAVVIHLGVAADLQEFLDLSMSKEVIELPVLGTEVEQDGFD